DLGETPPGTKFSEPDGLRWCRSGPGEEEANDPPGGHLEIRHDLVWPLSVSGRTLRGDAKSAPRAPLDSDWLSLQIDIEEPRASRFTGRIKRGLDCGKALADPLFERLDRVHCSHTPFPSAPG